MPAQGQAPERLQTAFCNCRIYWKIPVGKMASPRRGGGGSSAADERILVPVDFEPPSSAGTDDFILRMLCSEDLERDFAAGT